MILCAVGVAVAAPLAKRVPAFPAELVIGMGTSVWTFALTVLFVRWERLRLRDVGAALSYWSVPRALLGFLLGVGLLTAWAIGSAAAGPVSWKFSNDSGLSTFGLFTLAYVLLACREELAFHGYPLRRLDACFGMWAAQMLVALVFVAEHHLGGMSWPQAFLGPGVGSVLFGMAAISTRGLAIPVGLHAGWNVGHWSLGLKGNGGFWQGVVPPGQENDAEFVAMVAYVAVMGAATLAFLLRCVVARKTEQPEQPR